MSILSDVIITTVSRSTYFFQTKGQSDFNLQAGKHILMPSVNITGPKQSRLRM